MAKKATRSMSSKGKASNPIQSVVQTLEPTFTSWDNDTEKQGAFKEWSLASEEFQAVCPPNQKANATFFTNLSNLAPNVGSRPGMSNKDYYRFRPDEAPPKRIKDSIVRCNLAYHEFGIIRNVIDLMSEFASAGVRIVHPNKKIEKFYQNWFKRVRGIERSERFLNLLFRVGNVITTRQTAKISISSEDKLYKSHAADTTVKHLKVNSREIPWKYTFINPCIVDVYGGGLSSFMMEPLYSIQLDGELKRFINGPKNQIEKDLLAQLPPDVINAAKGSGPYPLPKDKTIVHHYKKDDWQDLALPMMHSILKDLTVLDKLKLADMASLDGATSKVRVWKLGSLDHKIGPSRAGAARLASILGNNTGGGTIDLVWGPDIELLESKTDTFNFLGKEKYQPHLQQVLMGLGIPGTVAGINEGTTNNYISMQVMQKRLEYGRSILVSFWENEIRIVQEAMGFRFAAKLEFDINMLGDELAEKNLLLSMSDRGLVSDEYLQLRLKHDPEMEKVRIKRESNERNKGQMPQKASPFFDPQFGLSLKKVALQTKTLMPSEVGLRNDASIEDLITYEPNETDKKMTDLIHKSMIKPQNSPQSKPTKVGVPGRPVNSKDKVQRKKKQFKPKMKAELEIWATNAQSIINETVNQLYLEQLGKSNMRKLTAEESNIAEKIKFDTLFGLSPMSKITDETILGAMTQGESPKNAYRVYNSWLHSIGNDLGRDLTMDEMRQIQVNLYSNINM
jgi:hypothetical protein